MARTIRRLDPDQQRRNRRRIILFSVLGAVALVLLSVLSFALRLTGGPPLPRDVRERIRATQQASGPSGTARAPGPTGQAPVAGPDRTPVSANVPSGTPPFREQVRRTQEAATGGDIGVRRLYITDAELSAELAGAIRNNPEVQEAQAYFDTGKAYLTARVSAKGHDWNLTLVLEPVVVNGGLQFGVAEAYVGKVSAPPAIVERIQRELSKRGSWFSPEKTGLYVEKVELKSGVAVLTGRPAPKR